MSAEKAFRDFMALAFPWLQPVGADYRNMRAAFEAGWKAGQEATRATDAMMAQAGVMTQEAKQ